MHYPCAKFGDFSFSRFGFIVQTESLTERQMIAILMRPLTNVDVSNNIQRLYLARYIISYGRQFSSVAVAFNQTLVYTARPHTWS